VLREREPVACRKRQTGRGRRTVILLVVVTALVALAGCSGGLFPSIVESGIEPQGCGSTKPRMAPYPVATPKHGVAPLAVAFTSEGSDVIEWRWSFGDGGTSSLQKPTYTYAVAGTYTVELSAVRTLADSSGLTKTETLRRLRYIRVSGRPDLVISGLTHTPDVAVPGTPVTFSVTASNVGTAAASAFYVHLSGVKSKMLARVLSLSPGASTTVVLTLAMSQANETFIVKADGTSRIRELNERNNEARHTVSATP
jgi:PKD repeat protein